jgi:hypothetical protein
MVVVVVTETMQLENDLPKQLMRVVGCSHTQGFMANSMRQYARPGSADFVVLRLQLSPFAFGS